MPGQLLDPQTIRSWARLAAGALGRDRALLDSANVFPVPDGDTGTNLYLTARAGAQAVAQMPPEADAASLLAALARGALVGARGNSGTILAEWLRGLALAATRGEGLSDALGTAATTARQAVAKPAPGTILTAADAAARRIGADGGMVEAAVAGARDAAAHSPDALPQLAKAGTLDAGACGLVLVLDALRAVLGLADAAPGPAAPESMATTAFLTAAPVSIGLDLKPRSAQAEPSALTDALEISDHYGGDEDEFEVMFTFWRPADATGFAPGQVAEKLRAELGEIGDSVVVIGGAVSVAVPAPEAPAGSEQYGETPWHAHVHVADLAQARELILRWAELGRVEQIQVRYLAVPNSDLTVFATTSTPALADEFARAGAVVVANEGIGAEPSGSGAHAGPAASSGSGAPTLTAEQLAQAALGSATPGVLVLAPGDAVFAAEVQRRVDQIVAESEALGALQGAGALPQVKVISTPTDVQTAVALGVLAETEDASASDRENAVAATMASTAVTDIADARDPDAIARVLSAARGPAAASDADGDRGIGPSPLVTALVDADVPESVVERLNELGGDNLVLIETQKPGIRVELAVGPGG